MVCNDRPGGNRPYPFITWRIMGEHINCDCRDDPGDPDFLSSNFDEVVFPEKFAPKSIKIEIEFNLLYGIPLLPILNRYTALPGDSGYVLRSLCDLLSEQPVKVDWRGFTQQDWLLLEKMAVDEGVAAMAYFLLHTNPEGYHLADFDQAAYQTLSGREAVNAIRNAVLFKRLSEILQVFQSQEIHVVLLKGADLAQSLYPEPGLRWLTDLDLLVHEASLEKALAIAHDLGYSEYLPEAFPGLDKLLSYHTHMQKDGRVPVLLELHWSLVGSEAFRYAVSMDWFWQNLIPSQAAQGEINLETKNYCFSLNPNANLLYLSAHQMLQHGGELTSLYWLLDIHRLITCRDKQIDWQALVEQAGIHAWSGAVQAALEAVKDCFDTNLPDGILSRLQAQTGPNDVLVEMKSTQASTHILGEWKKISSLSWRGRILLVLALTFPAPAYMRWRYDPHPPWIWPIYYVFRWTGILFDVVRTAGQLFLRLVNKLYI